MKINHSNYSQFINQLYKKNSDNKYEKRKHIDPSKDTVQLSKTSKDIQKYIDQMKDIETGNKDKIEKIKQKLDAGTYKVSSKELAHIILDKINQENKGDQ